LRQIAAQIQREANGASRSAPSVLYAFVDQANRSGSHSDRPRRRKELLMSTPKPAARFVLSRMPQGSWLSHDDVAKVVEGAGIDPDPGYIQSVVRSLHRRGQLVTNAATNQVMRPPSKVAT
jgi:hypothetical protein